MTAAGWIEIALYIAILTALTPLLGGVHDAGLSRRARHRRARPRDGPLRRPRAGLEGLRPLRARVQRGLLRAAVPDPAHPGHPPLEPERLRLGALRRRVQHDVVVRHQHELAVLRRRDDDVELLADGRPGRAELRLGGRRHRRRDRVHPRARRPLGQDDRQLLQRPRQDARLRPAADLDRGRPRPRLAGRHPVADRRPGRLAGGRSRSSAPTAAASSTSTPRIRSRTRPGSRTSSRCC